MFGGLFLSRMNSMNFKPLDICIVTLFFFYFNYQVEWTFLIYAYFMKFFIITLIGDFRGIGLENLTKEVPYFNLENDPLIEKHFIFKFFISASLLFLIGIV